MSFEAKLQIFEGPLDLLLHLVRANEVDISDIPIAIITDQYLEYLDLMRALDINVAGDFLVMASTLMHIKSKMLLPRAAEDGEELEDPRDEIVRPLMAYVQLKEAADELVGRDILDRDVFTRGIEEDESDDDEDLNATDVNLYQLMEAFKRVIKRRYPDVVLSFTVETWSVKQKMAEIRDRLKGKKRILFRELFTEAASLSEMIATFLALLELVKIGFMNVLQEHPDKDILLEAFA
ncbi:MAG: segregation/condensation protein A [Deltaproteobacteria bacterium]|nr:MAG: segregation/condensation protein A [Deltaproteobacteria bacterium]UCH07407.1 MAG: segregation/condensation protein A [Deltaproteobacteria bacterium]